MKKIVLIAFFIISIISIISLPAMAGSKKKAPPVTVVVGTVEQANQVANSRVSNVIVDPALRPVTITVPARVETVYSYVQWQTNRYAIDENGKRVIVNSDNQVLSEVAGSLATFIPGGGQPTNTWYQPPPQDPPATSLYYYPYIAKMKVKYYKSGRVKVRGSYYSRYPRHGADYHGIRDRRPPVIYIRP